MEQQYTIKMDNFEGPLDLLCHLIDKNQMDIFDIRISEITTQYLEYLSYMQQMNLEITSEFIVMASKLIYLKSKQLLPKENDGEEDDDEVFADVVASDKVEPKKEEPELITPAKTTEVKKAELVEPVVSAQTNVEETNVEAEEAEPSVTYRLETIYFDNGSAVVASEYKAKIREAAKLVKNNNAKIRVLGFSSSRTRNMDIASHKLANFKISAERAENVATALRKAGVPADSITVEALSDTAPAYLEVMPEGERLNRRAEIYVSY